MIASAKEIDALNITLFNSCINFTKVNLCNYCTKIFVIVVNTCVCRRSVDNKALILSYPIPICYLLMKNLRRKVEKQHFISVYRPLTYSTQFWIFSSASNFICMNTYSLLKSFRKRKKLKYPCKRYLSEHNSGVPPFLSEQFHVLTKGSNKFDCLFIRKFKPSENVQADSIHAKVFTWKTCDPLLLC